MEAMSVEQRLDRLERLNGIAGPAICPDPTGEGSAWQGEGAPVIPLEDGFDGVHPDDARDGDEFFNGGWNIAGDVRTMPSWLRTSVPWRRRKSPSDPAPGSDAERPPIGYRLAKAGENRLPGYVYFVHGKWVDGERELFGDVISDGWAHPIANPIPANEGDSQKEVAELRATVERLTAERDELRGKLAKVAEVLG